MCVEVERDIREARDQQHPRAEVPRERPHEDEDEREEDRELSRVEEHLAVFAGARGVQGGSRHEELTRTVSRLLENRRTN